MRLLEASIRGFGRLTERQFAFAPGAALIVGVNESGKSTLLQFLLSMLFGMKRHDRRRRDYLAEYERYRPWSGAPYAGRLVYELANGERFEVLRVFDRREESVRVLDAVTGRDRTQEFPLDERKERQFLQRQIQLSRQLFEATTAMGQLAGRPAADGVAALRERIQGLLDSGDERTSAHAALASLAQLQEREGSERTPTRGLGLLLGRRAALQAELEAARLRHAEIFDLHARRDVVAADYAAAAAAWGEARRAERRRERAQLAGRWRRWQDLAEECRALEHRLQESAEVADVDLAADAPAREHAARAAALLAEVEERQRQLEVARLQEAELGRFEAGLAAALGGLDRAAADRLQRQAEQLREHLGRVREARARHADEQRRNRAIVEELRRHHGRDWSRDEFLGELRAQRQRARGDEARELGAAAAAAAALEQRRRFALAAWSLTGAAGVAVIAAMAGSDPWQVPAWLRLGSPLLAAAVVLALNLAALRRLVFARDVSRSLSTRAAQAALSQSTATEWLDGMLQRNGVATLDELEAARLEYENLRARAGGISAAGGRDLQLLESEMLRLADAVQSAVRGCDLGALQALQAAPVAAARGVLPFAEEESATAPAAEDSPELRRFVSDLQRVPQISRACLWRERLREERATLHAANERAAADLEQRAGRLASEQAALAAILQRNGAADFEAFTVRLGRGRERQNVLATLAALQREQRGILGEESSAALGARLAALDAAVDAAAPPGSSGVAATPVGMDASAALPSLEMLARESDRLAAECAQIEERLASREREGRLPAEIALELQEVDAGVERERGFHAAVQLAVDTLQQVTTVLHREAAPRLNERVGHLFARLSRGAHLEVRLDEDLTPRVRVDGEAMVGVESLSGGAADQLYFALRVTAGEILARQGEPLPLLLDDPFVQYDPERLQAGLDLVAALAQRHQILYFTSEEPPMRQLEARLEALGVPSNVLHL